MTHERFSHPRLGGPRLALKQRRGRDDHSRGTVAALGSLLGNERTLQAVRLLRCTESLNRGHRLAIDPPGWSLAGRDRLPIDQHVTGAALPRNAGSTATLQSKLVAQQIEQITSWLALKRDRHAIQGEFTSAHA